LEQQPGNLPIRMNLALAYYKAAKIPQAATELEGVVADRPVERQPVLLLSDCYLRLGENGKAIDLLTPLQQQTPDDKALDYMLGTALIRDGQTARGELLVDRILRDGDSAEAHLLMGESKLSANDFAGALEEFQKALAIDPQLPSLNGYYGTALADTGDIPGAEAAFRKELAADLNDYVANFQLGKLLEGDGNYAESRRCFERALAQRPHDRGARYQLALLDLESGQAEQARAALESLVGENPQDVDAHVSLATAYYRLKRKQEGNKQRAIVLELNAAKRTAVSAGMSK
jgi:tetratricopeptide (TPR) repeat protein